ncbi:YibE/F family protein [Corynebacterium ulceribovis]|uniref:YibE/F family protein n=1 Tax=Corynebacterium ulceribovis TaxID=487732 RepID=UPI000379E618|nr:YibE/F family protein [Corynebacterium ulceribovis]
MGRHSLHASGNSNSRRARTSSGAHRSRSDRNATGRNAATRNATGRDIGAQFNSLTAPRKTLIVGLAAALLFTLIGALLLWPSGPAPEPAAGFRESQHIAANTVTGTVIEADDGPCGSAEVGRVFDTSPTFPEGSHKCHRALIKLTSGDESGRYTLIETSGQPGEPTLASGDRVTLAVHDGPHFTFVDMDRTIPIWIWIVVTVALIALVGAKRGLLALVGLAITLLTVAVFLVPGLLRSGDPVWLAVVTGALVMFPVIFLVHGVNWKSASSLGGTLITLVLSAGLAQVAIATTQLRGLSDESNLLLQLYLPSVSVTGLLLAGFIVGALGVLNDVTIAQASTVQELYDANPTLKPWRVFKSAMHVGQDHIASMVYTLVLAYLGAALPMSMLLAVADRPVLGIISSDLVAVELMRSAVGALALTAAVPITTAIAAWTVQSTRQSK